MRARRPLVAGNWKMNGLKANLEQISLIAAGIDAELNEKVDLMICLPATLIAMAVGQATKTPIKIGGEDCHAKASGALLVGTLDAVRL